MSQWLSVVYTWISSELLTRLGFLLALIFVANLLRQRRSPSSTIAWLLVILLEPYLGVPLYVVFGGRKMNPLARKKARIYSRSLDDRESSSGVGTERLLASYGVPPAREGNRLELVTDGVDAYQRILRMIADARLTIHITTYILGWDAGSQPILERLKERASARVAVRLLIDDLGSWRLHRRFLAPADRGWRAGCLLHAGTARPIEGTSQPEKPPEAHRGRRPDRTHGRDEPDIALRGSARHNPPLARYRGRRRRSGRSRHGRDLRFGLEIHDRSGAGDFGRLLRAEQRPTENADTMQVVASGPDVAGDPLYESLLALIFSASKRIWVVTPYFVPDEMLARALNLAARRGVNVRLIVPARSNHITADFARGGYLRDLHNAGGKVLLHAPVMLHAKAIIFDDDLAIIGSANMDMRSLFLNYEMALFLWSPSQVQVIATWAKGLMVESQRELPAPDWPREIAENVVRLISPLL